VTLAVAFLFVVVNRVDIAARFLDDVEDSKRTIEEKRRAESSEEQGLNLHANARDHPPEEGPRRVLRSSSLSYRDIFAHPTCVSPRRDRSHLRESCVGSIRARRQRTRRGRRSWLRLIPIDSTDSPARRNTTRDVRNSRGRRVAPLLNSRARERIIGARFHKRPDKEDRAAAVTCRCRHARSMLSDDVIPTFQAYDSFFCDKK